MHKIEGKITLSGQAKSTNHIYRYACMGNSPTMYMITEGKNIKDQYQLEAQAQWKNGRILDDLEVTLHFYHGDQRKRDIDNYNKIVLDALAGIVYFDDKQIKSLNISKFYDKENPRVEVEIKEL